MTIKFQTPKDNPNRENLLKQYIDYLKSESDFLETKSSYEAFFYIGKLCSLIPTQNEYDIFLENRNVFHIFIQALKSLYEKWETLDFNGKTIEKDEPKLDKNFKESIFVYILYSINILNKNFKVNLTIYRHILE